MSDSTNRKNDAGAENARSAPPAFVTPFADDRIAWSSTPRNGLVTAVVVGPDNLQRLRIHVRRYKLVGDNTLVPLPGGGASLTASNFAQAVERVRDVLGHWGVSL